MSKSEICDLLPDVSPDAVSLVLTSMVKKGHIKKQVRPEILNMLVPTMLYSQHYFSFFRIKLQFYTSFTFFI